APANRLTILLGGLLASFIVQAFAMALLLIYTGIILKVDFRNRIDLVILLSLVGSLTGNSLGLLTGSMTFKNENSRIGVAMAVTMLGCFLAGMMGISMKYIVDKNIPIINKLNPASMITDGFYSLYYYDTLDRYWFNIGSLLVVSFILLIISYILMRRKKYDSI
ncbi:MAG TPA: ABC transporter permease, partial [Bacilli bacterium]|nr:ABC transporter permease [Bacilli bacterium]